MKTRAVTISIVGVVIVMALVGAWLFRPAGAHLNDKGEQVATITVTDSYRPESVKLKAGVPAVLKLVKVDERHCTEEFQIPDYGIKVSLPPAKTTEVRFTPSKAGVVPFMCGMDMVHGQLVVEGRS